jgi:hypothetical protein
MSLIRPRWILLGATAGAYSLVLWSALGPQRLAETALPPIGRVDADYYAPAPLDLAVSSGLFVANQTPDLPQGNETEPQAAPATSPPRLVGLAAKRGASVALAVDQAGQTRLLRSGEDIDGGKLTGIGRDHVIFVQGERKERVALDFANRGGSATGAPTRQLIDMGDQ